MPVVTTTTSTLRRIASHDISFNGLAGVILIVSLVGFLLYIVGFSTVGWLTIELPAELFPLHNVSTMSIRMGLWQSCYCGQEIHDVVTQEAWFMASKVLVIMGLAGLSLTVVFTTLYMFVHRLSKDRVIQAVIGTSIISMLFIVIGVIVFGVKSTNYATTRSFPASQSYSFAFVIGGGIMTAIVAVLGFIQNVRAKRKGTL